MAVLLSQVSTEGWRLGAPRELGELTIYPIAGGEPLIQLVERSEIAECTTPFPPSTFTDGPRRGIVVAAAWGRVETWAAGAMKDAPGKWASSIRQYDSFTGIRAKIDIRRVQIVDIEGRAMTYPERWTNTIVPILQVRGIYQQGDTYGLLVEAAALLIGPPRTRQLAFI